MTVVPMERRLDVSPPRLEVLARAVSVVLQFMAVQSDLVQKLGALALEVESLALGRVLAIPPLVDQDEDGGQADESTESHTDPHDAGPGAKTDEGLRCADHR